MKTAILVVLAFLCISKALAALDHLSHAERQDFCSGILDTAYPIGTAIFSSCEMKKIDNLHYKIIINLRGGFIGTPYILKGDIFIEKSLDGFATRWKYWNSPLVPADRTFLGSSSKWDF